MFDRGYNGKLWGTRGVDAYTPRPRGGIVTGCSRKFLPTRNSLNNYARPADDDDDARPTTPILPLLSAPSVTPSSTLEESRNSGYALREYYRSSSSIRTFRCRFIYIYIYKGLRCNLIEKYVT